MNSAKTDNQLNLALDATNAEREKTLDLEVGFEPEEQRWELIVRYTDDLQRVETELSATVTALMNGYAVLTLPESQIGRLADYEEIIFIEKPKRLFFAVNQGKAVSCIVPVQRPPYSLTGRGVIVGLIDSGESVIILSGRCIVMMLGSNNPCSESCLADCTKEVVRTPLHQTFQRDF